jgi:tetratricopeptide (TPR) repeat protein
MWRLVVLVACVPVLTGGGAWAQVAAEKPAEAARRHDARGVAAGDAGRLDEALREFETAIGLDPGYAPAHFHRGLALERTGRLREALTAYQRALRAQPDLFEARYGLSSVCAKLGDLDGAIALLRQIVAALPDLAEARYNLGVNLWNRYKKSTGLRRTQDLDAALEELKVAVRLAPAQPTFHVALGQLLADRQQLHPALESLRKALELSPAHPADPMYSYDLGLVLRLAGDLEGAEAQFRAALKTTPAHGFARRALALVLRQKGDLEGAASELRAASKILSVDAETHHLLGSVLLKLNREGALDALARAVELDPSSTDARVTFAQALARAGNNAEAERQQAEVRQINVENAGMSRAMMLLESAAGLMSKANRTAAIERLWDAVAASSSFAEPHYQLALAMRPPAGDAKVSEAQFLRAVQLDPDHAQAHHQLGVLRARRGDLPAALASLRRATELAPGLVDAQRELAAQAWNAHDRDAVLSALTAVIAWEPGDAMAHYALARALGEQGDRDEAARELAIAQRLNPSLRIPQ